MNDKRIRRTNKSRDAYKMRTKKAPDNKKEPRLAAFFFMLRDTIVAENLLNL